MDPDQEDAADHLADPTADVTMDPEAEADSGVPSSPGTSSRLSRFPSESSSVAVPDWSEHSVIPSEVFQPCGIFPPLFNIWSPTTEDECVLELLGTSPPSTRSVSPSSSTSSFVTGSSLSSSSDGSSAAPHWESDEFEWGEFQLWNPVPTPSEAEILSEQQRVEEEEIHARAAQKRAIKKAKYFARYKHFAQLRC
ncbi:hypothetical protein ONE63_004132 [Megalurothrips usitatus]|uniref:Uncharacterized protein n=1 Tax=Megalurothrips usitatus TaxID=439358 RepID=A0AAV7X632_9NEOP|nr:hypothetical protein ONE63_004132 [Megalurothrips usitatus]